MYYDHWLLVVTSASFMLQSVTATWDHLCSESTRRHGPHRYGVCGNRIDETLSFLCGSFGFNENPTTFMNSFSDMFRKKRDVESEIKKKIPGLFIPRNEANSYIKQEALPSSREKRSAFYTRGIVCECCYHQCSFTELMSYCKFSIFKRSLTERQMKLYSQKYSND